MLPLYSRALMTKVFPRTLPSGQETPCHLSFFYLFFSFYLKKKTPYFLSFTNRSRQTFSSSPFRLFFFLCKIFFPILQTCTIQKKRKVFFPSKSSYSISTHTTAGETLCQQQRSSSLYNNIYQVFLYAHTVLYIILFSFFFLLFFLFFLSVCPFTTL